LNAPVNDLMNIVLVESLNAHSHNRARTEVNKLMGDLSLISTYACFKPASGAMDINQNVLGLLLILITCLVVLFSFVNRYSSILERLHDFGILSAIGWSNFKIVSIIVFESLIQITAGGFISFFFLLLFINIMPLQDMINTNILFDMQTSFSVYVLGFMLVLVAAIIGIIFPALSMIKKLPSENLRILY
jgi:putative ABC transport system permease protein